MRRVIIREAQDGDAAALHDLMPRLDAETEFLLYEPGERNTTVEEWTKRIADHQASGNSVLLLADDDGQLVGFLHAWGSPQQRIRHSVHLAIGVLQSHSGQGIGTRLFQELERLARSHGVTRLELTVMVHNQRGINLYQKMGFEIEGTRKRSVRVNGHWVDEYAMAKLLD